MSYNLKLSVALTVAVLALPTLAIAQDPSTRTDLTIVGAVLIDDSEQVADTNVVSTSEMPIVYEDDTAVSGAENTTTEGEAAASSEAE